MNYGLKQMRKRALAFLLAVLVLVTSLPVDTSQVLAAVDTYTNFTFKVTDGTNAIVGADVRIYDETDPSLFDVTHQTGDDGVAEFAEFTELEVNGEDVTYKYEVTMEGYETASGEVSNTVNDWNGHIDVELTLLPLDIPDDSYTVTAYTGVYDGQPHSVSVEVAEDSDYTVEYSEDGGLNYSETNPEYTNVCENTVYIRISKDGYTSEVVESKVEITPAQREDFAFAISTPDNLIYDESISTYPAFQNVATSQTEASDLSVTYAITYESESGIATVDSATGEVQFTKPGTVTITATLPASTSGNYAASTASYTIAADLLPRTGFVFVNGDAVTVTYGDNGNVYQNLATDADNDGTISYSIESQVRDGEEITEPDLYVAEMDENGNLSILASGVVVVKATIAGGETHQDAEITYTLTVEKAEQPDFAFEQEDYDVVYGTESATYAVPTGVSGEETIYTISSGTDIATINEKTGEVSFISQKQGTVTIVASNAGDNCYKEATATCTVHVAKIALDMTDSSIKPIISVSEGENNWYIGGVEIQAQAGYQISKSDAFDAEWADTVTFTDEGEDVVFDVYLKTSTGAISEAISYGPYKIDTEAPCDLEIEYEETVAGTILAAIAGFFKNEVTVALTAKDEVSGISYFVYKISDEAEEVIVERENLTVDENNAAIMSTTFKIPAQYKGKVTFTAYDEAGLNTKVESDEFVVDNLEPGITVTFGNDTATNENYYKADRTATIQIKEANFDQNDVVIEEGKKLYGETVYTTSTVTPAFEYNAELDVWEMTYSFTESADYTFKVAYTDKSENVGIVNGSGTEYYSEFTIDKISPILKLSYADNAEEDTYYFTDNRTATFVITEHNFNAADIAVEISAVDVNNNPIDLSEQEYAAYLTNPDNWSANGDVYTASIEIEEEGHYTIEMTYADKAGRQQDEAILDTFCIDKTAPVELKISYSDNAVWEGILNALTFGFYQEKVTVTIEAVDNISKIARFDYVYSVSDDASANATGGSGSFDASQLSFEGGKATVSFDIQAQFRGHVSFTAVNEAAMGASVSDENEKEIVVDGEAPVIEVTYDNNNVINGKYYKADRTATIKIREDNFYGTEAWNKSDLNDYIPGTTEEYLVISVGKRLVNETDFSITKVKPDFVYNASEDCYEATVLFGETAEYTFDIKYTDRSGNVYDSYEMDEFVVDKTGPVLGIVYDNNDVFNGSYYKDDRIATITVEELCFEPGNIEFAVTAVDANGEEIDLSDKDYAGLLQDAANWKKDGDTYSIDVPFNVDGVYTVEMTCVDIAENQEKEAISEDFCIDKVDPEVAKISYSTPILEKIIETVTFGFYQAPVEVTLQAKDVTSGINSFMYSYGEVEDVVVTTPDLTVAGDSAEYTFKIPAQFKGTVSFTAIDNVDRSTKIVGDIVIVVDDKAPEVTVEYTNDSAVNDTYYSDNRTAKIIIDEDNFYATAEWNYADYEDGYLTINVGKRLAGDTEYKVRSITPEFTRNEETGCYEANVEFAEEADYTFTISYTDRAGNAYEGYWDAFTIDKTKPVLEISYNDDEAANEIYYNADRTATIKVTEHNFNPEGIVFTVEAAGVNNSSVDLDAKGYAAYLRDSANWKQDEENKDVYTATVTFDIEGMYTISMKCTDLAGNVQEEIVDPFCIDKTVPVLEISYNNNEVTNDIYYNADRTATITVTEDNFNPKDVVFTATAVDLNNKSVSLTSKDYAAYLKESANWKQDTEKGNVYTATVKFDIEGMYTIGMEYTDLAGNVQEEIITDTFCIDKTAPTECKFTIEKSGDDVTGNSSIAFDKFYNEEVRIKINADYNVSGLDKIQYQKVNSISDYNVNGEWTDYKEEAGIVVKPNEKFILFAKIVDMAGNVAMANSTGIVVDDRLPVDETMAPEINIGFAEPEKSGYYTENIELQFSIIDPAKDEDSDAEQSGYYSGLNKVTCVISSSELGKTKTIDLFKYEFSAATGELVQNEGATYDEDNLASAWKGSCTIAASEFSCNDVVVTIVAIDNAGNERKTSTTAGDIMIDVVAPEIKVEVSNSDVDSENIFKDNRTAKITIKERNFTEKNVKLTITNTDGTVPGHSGWTSSGKGNDMVWTTTIVFDTDGDYELGISYVDPAGNPNKTVVYEGVAPQKFTIDKTIPEVQVTYNNNDALNQNYYKEARTATVSIKEHNFDASRVKVTMTATDDGAGTTLPAMSGWSSAGDVHTATISYDNDALYTFDIEVKDKAGNNAEDFVEQTFYVDKTAPELTIDGILKFANNGTIAPIVTYSDTNYDPSQVEIKLEGVNNGRVSKLDGSYVDIHNGQTFKFNNFAEEKDVDDIYTLTVNLTDKAGNTTTDSVMFSVNRFGSTYDLSAVADINGNYVKEAKDLVIKEVNVNALTNIKITLFKNNETIVLEEGVDYRIDIEGNDEEGYIYTYTIFKANFAEDGVYRITIHSEDAAGNVAENNLDVKDKEISFGIDSTVPNINVTNLESDTTYVLENLQVIMLISDNLLLNNITVYLDDYNTAYKVWNAEEIAQVLAENGEFTFDVPGGSISAHNVKIICQDAAGNEQVIEFTDFYVTTNVWVRYYNNKPLFFGSIGGGLALIGLLVILGTRKKKVEK